MMYTVLITHESDPDVFVATIPALDLVTQGKSEALALKAAAEAIWLDLDGRRSHDAEIPMEDNDYARCFAVDVEERDDGTTESPRFTARPLGENGQRAVPDPSSVGATTVVNRRGVAHDSLGSLAKTYGSRIVDELVSVGSPIDNREKLSAEIASVLLAFGMEARAIKGMVPSEPSRWPSLERPLDDDAEANVG